MGTIKICTKEDFFKLFRIRFEKQNMKYEKSEKLSVEISIWVENGKQTIFFSKAGCLRYRWLTFFLGTAK